MIIIERKDFFVLMQIYLNTTDSALVSCYLKEHLVLNEKGLKKIENGINNGELEIKENLGKNYIQFVVDLTCLYNSDHFYHKFIKGILLYLK